MDWTIEQYNTYIFHLSALEMDAYDFDADRAIWQGSTVDALTVIE